MKNNIVRYTIYLILISLSQIFAQSTFLNKSLFSFTWIILAEIAFRNDQRKIFNLIMTYRIYTFFVNTVILYLIYHFKVIPFDYRNMLYDINELFLFPLASYILYFFVHYTLFQYLTKKKINDYRFLFLISTIFPLLEIIFPQLQNKLIVTIICLGLLINGVTYFLWKRSNLTKSSIKMDIFMVLYFTYNAVVLSAYTEDISFFNFSNLYTCLIIFIILNFTSTEKQISRIVYSKFSILFIAMLFLFAQNFEIEFIDRIKYLVAFCVITYFYFEIKNINTTKLNRGLE